MSENKQPEHQNTAPPQGQMYIPPQYYAPQDDEIDLRELFGVLWKGKWWIIGITALFAIASVFYALSLPNEYKATAIVAPASEQGGGGLGQMAGQLGGLASLAGINLGGGESNDSVIAMEIMKTWGFQEDFIKKHDLEVPIFAARGWNQSTNELIAAQQTIREMCQTFGADSLGFLSEQGVVDAVGLSTTEPYGGLCMAYFNGDYPTALYDYQAEYDAEIAQLQANHEGVIK